MAVVTVTTTGRWTSAQSGMWTSGEKTDKGTSVQKKPRDTQWVENLRMPK
jgi:ribosomal protein L24E